MAETYIPDFETQTDDGAPLPWTNCTLASGAMLVDWWTWGIRKTNDVVLRQASGVNAAVGTNFANVRTAIAKVLGLDMLYSEWDRSGNKNVTWGWLRDHLANGGGAAVAGQFSRIRGFTNAGGQAMDRWQPGGDFGHAVFVCDYRPKASGGDGRVRWMDPLGRGSYTGDRVPIEALWAFIFKSGNTQDAMVAAAHGFTGARPPQQVPGPTGTIKFRDPVVRQDWTTVKGASFTRADGTFGQFLQEVRVTSIVEITVGGKDCRVLDYGPDHEQLQIFRTGLKDPGPRIVGSPSGIYDETQLAAARNAGYRLGKEDGFEAGKVAGRAEGIEAARKDLEDLK